MALPAKVLLDASFVVVTQPSIQPSDELVSGYTCPVSGVEDLVLEPSEEPSIAALSGVQPFFDIDRCRPARSQMLIHSGHL